MMLDQHHPARRSHGDDKGEESSSAPSSSIPRRRRRRNAKAGDINSAVTVLLFLSMLLLSLPFSAEAKTTSGIAKLTGAKTERTLVKFAVSPHATGKVELTLNSEGMYVDESNLRLHLYVDDDWSIVKKEPLCQKKIRRARKSIPVVFAYMGPDPTGVKDKKTGLPLERYTTTIKTTIDGEDSTRPQYWYLTLDDCSLEKYQHDADAPPMDFTISIWDDAEGVAHDEHDEGDSVDHRNYATTYEHMYSHLPADERGMGTLHMINLVLSCALVVVLSLRIMGELRSHGEVHAAVLVVIVSCLFNGSSSLCELIHRAAYERNGVGSYLFDALSSHLEAMSDATVSLVLLSVGSGWTLPADVVTAAPGGASGLGTASSEKYSGGGVKRVSLVDGLRNPAGSLLALFTPGCRGGGGGAAGLLSLSVLLVHAVLAQWGRTYDDDFDSYHGLEHPPGRALLSLRIGLGLAFLTSVASIRNGGRCPPSLLGFLTKFAAVGAAWFASLPFVSWFVVSSLPYHLRHQALSIGCATVQIASLGSLAWLFAARRDASAYHRLSRVKHDSVGDLTDRLASSSSTGGGGGGGISSSSASSAPSNGRYPPARPTLWRFGKTKIRLD